MMREKEAREEFWAKTYLEGHWVWSFYESAQTWYKLNRLCSILRSIWILKFWIFNLLNSSSIQKKAQMIRFFGAIMEIFMVSNGEWYMTSFKNVLFSDSLCCFWQLFSFENNLLTNDRYPFISSNWQFYLSVKCSCF